MKKEIIFFSLMSLAFALFLFFVPNIINFSNKIDDKKEIIEIYQGLNLHENVVNLEKQYDSDNRLVSSELVQEVVLIEEDDDSEFLSEIEADAYQIGYKNGMVSFLNQINYQHMEEYLSFQKENQKEDEIIEDKVKEFTSLNLKNQEIIERAMEKGYTDGYHKAGDLIYCPR